MAAEARRPRAWSALALAFITVVAAGCTTTPEETNGEKPEPAAPASRAPFRVAFIAGVHASPAPAPRGAPDPMNLLADALTRLSTEVRVDAAILAGDLVAPAAANAGAKKDELRATLESVLDTASGLPCTVHVIPGTADLTALAIAEGASPDDAKARAEALAAFRRLVDARRPAPPVASEGGAASARIEGLEPEGAFAPDRSAWLGLASPGLYLLVVETALLPPGGVGVPPTSARDGGAVSNVVAPWLAPWLEKIERASAEVLVIAAHPLEGAAGSDALLAALAKSSAVRAVATGTTGAARTDEQGGLIHVATPALARWPLAFRVIEITPGSEGKLEWHEIGLPEERDGARKAAGAGAETAAGASEDRAGPLPPR